MSTAFPPRSASAAEGGECEQAVGVFSTLLLLVLLYLAVNIGIVAAGVWLGLALAGLPS